ncbi:MAG: universal stress protein [Acidobacteriota bacterium]
MIATQREPRDILMATDFSDQSEQALRVAADYARCMGARLHVLHVGSEIDAVAHTERWAGDRLPGTTMSWVVEPGRPADAIVRYATDHDIGMIVVGTHGRTGFSHALLGSVAEKVARTAPCPVLTVPPSMEGPPPPRSLTHVARCLVCAGPSDELICQACRSHIRAQALDRHMKLQRTGHE